MAAWLSNFCHGFRAPLDTFSPKMESETKVEKDRPTKLEKLALFYLAIAA